MNPERQTPGSEFPLQERDEKIRSPQREREVLSPEIIEGIMGKVQDIDADGTAYHVITEPHELPGPNQDIRPYQERFEDVLEYGLLGSARSERGGIAQAVAPKQWKDQARKEKRGEVMFNIVGREFSDTETADEERREAHNMGQTWIESGLYMWQPGNKIAVIFDLDRFQEVEPRKDESLGLSKPGTFHADSPETRVDEKGRIMAEHGYGFSLYPRVSQRAFRGIVFKMARRYTPEEIENQLKAFGGGEDMKRSLENSWTNDDNPKDWEQRAEEIAASMQKVYNQRQELMVPIYDVHGNLYWPKKMSHAEVKALTGVSTGEKKEIGEKKFSRTVLEIGCGRSVAPWLEERNLEEYREAHIVRTDIKKEKLKDAKESTEGRIEKLGDRFNGKVEYMAADATNLPFESNSLDEVYIANVLGDPDVSEVNARDKIITEAARVLKENGELIIAEWATPEFAVGIGNTRLTNRETWKFFLDAFTGRLARLGLEIKTVESPNYQPALDMRDKVPEEYKAIGKAKEEFLSNFPYGKKLISGLILPRTPADHPFVAVLRKIRSSGR